MSLETFDRERPAEGATDVARRAVAANPTWYHSIELAPGVVTPGQVDWRMAAGKVLPADLSGRRALDVGTFDGFWAFELERRGAEVVAIDTDTVEENEWPPLNRKSLQRRMQEFQVELGRGFRLAADALGSNVRRESCNVYDLSPDAIGGPVDVAFCGSILLHLRDPVRAVERMRDALLPGGTVVVLEPFSPLPSLLFPRRPVARFQATVTPFNWWYPNIAALMAWLRAGGLEDVRRRGLHRPPATGSMLQWYCALEARRRA